MSENFTNTTSAKTNSFNKGMVKDVTDIYMSEGLWTNAINAINNAHYGETGSIGNEPSNKLCVTASYTIIGFANFSTTKWVLFSTNDTSSEIGIFDEADCSYTAVANDKCLGFKRTHLISAVVKKNYDQTYSTYFVDNLNPDRMLNLSRVPYKINGYSNPDEYCYEPEYSDELDCDALRLHPLVTQPCVEVKKAQGSGQLNNGSYMACVAYSENGVRLTDYSIPSNPQALWDHSGIGGGIDIQIDNLDQDFEEYELVVIAVINQQTIAKKIGNYSIRQKTVTLDLFGQSLPTVDLAQIPLKSIVYERSQKLFDVNGYLVRTGVTTQPYFNYQLQANNIKAEWVAVEYPADYYYGGGNKVGYMRDEVYSFFIRWVYRTGTRSASFHIPGRLSNAIDTQAVNTADVVSPTETQAWQVYDTATKYNAFSTLPDGGTVIMKGDMAYWESTERYPDDKFAVWGELCGRPIRHHKMPSNETIHIHNQGGDKITVLGVEFSNITHPLDENGKPITDIVGYEILRGSREGNRSIVAKGMFNNMLEYNIAGSTSKKGLIQNYPYNDLRPDVFLSDDYSILEDGTGDSGKIERASKLDKYKRDLFSFHTAETNFIKPYLGGNHIKIYTEERGTVRGKYEFPHMHPRHIVLTDTAFGTAAVIGIGIAAISALGKTTISSEATIGAFGSGVTAGAATESGIATAPLAILSNVTNAPLTAAGIAAIATSSFYYLGQGVDQALEVLRKISRARQYAIQYNSHGFYNSYSNVSNASVPAGLAHTFRRKVSESGAKYVGSGLHDFDATYRINNLNRNKYVAVKLEDTLPDPTSTTDNTKRRIKDGGVSHSEPTKNEVTTNTVAYYGALKVDFQNQYGQLSAIVQLPVDSCIYTTEPGTATRYTSGVLFGGDVYINRYTEKNPYMFFNSWMYDMPDNTDYDYRNYLNGPAPRYWANFEKFDMSDVSFSFSDGLTTPSDFHRFDRPAGGSGLTVKNAYIYLFHNGVRDFFVESELNLAYRDYGENDHEKFYDVYGNSFNDLSTMFRSDLITKPIYHKYDLSLSSSKLFNNFASWGSILPRDFDPALYASRFEFFPNRAIYSLQQQDGLRRDNWRNFLPLNYKDLAGKVNTIKNLNATGAMILFENAEPVMFVGVDQLQTQGGVKVSIGDGGLFQGNQQAIVNADDSIGYASSISSRAAVNTPFGMFFVSQQSGKIMQYQNGIQEISRNGMKFWFNQNLPSRLLEAYPDFPLYDNPVAGIGVQAIYDPQYELLYFTKRDYTPVRSDLKFDDPSGVPYYPCGTTAPPAIECTIKPVTTVTTSGLNNDGSLTIGWGMSGLLPTDLPPTGYAINIGAETNPGDYPGIFRQLNVGPGNVLPGGTMVFNVPASCTYTGPVGIETHVLNNTTRYTVSITAFYPCGEAPASVRGTIPQIVAGTALYTNTSPGGIAPTQPVNCTSPLDIAFVLDITSSMGGTLTNLKTSITAIAQDAAIKSNNNYRLGLVTVNEVPEAGSGTTPVILNRTLFAQNNIAAFQTALNAVTIGDGVELPEPTDVAIDQVLNDDSLGEFRTEAVKMLILITDNFPSGYDDTYTIGVDDLQVISLSNDAAAMGVKIYPIITGEFTVSPSLNTLYNNYATITGGTKSTSISGNVGPIISDEILNVQCPSNCFITATRKVTISGELTTISWDAGGATSVSLSGFGSVPNAGSVTVLPTETTKYVLTVTHPNGDVSNCYVTITVAPVRDVKCLCEFDNPECFKRVDWTVSYDPKTQQWISFHDWKPSLMMPSYKHFFTINNNTIWRHNDRWDNFCNYYGTDHPWEVEYPVVTPNNITTLRNIEYTLEVKKFYNDGQDFHHILDENFDRAVVYNSEQISGLLKLNLKGKNAPLEMLNYPQITPNGIDILYSKEENKYRFNQFWDITKDRGEFSGAQVPMWNTRSTGYQKNINPGYVDYYKSAIERKKFRHYGNTILLRKTFSGDKKMVLKLTNTKHLNSPR